MKAENILANMVGSAISQRSWEDDFDIGVLIGITLKHAVEANSSRLGNIEQFLEGIKTGLEAP